MQGVVPINDTQRRSAIDRRTTRHRAYAVNQRIRMQIEQGFGWANTIGGMPKLKHRGLTNVNFHFTLSIAAYNMVRLRTIGVGFGHASMAPQHLLTLVAPKWQEKLAYLGALNLAFPSDHSKIPKSKRFSTSR